VSFTIGSLRHGQWPPGGLPDSTFPHAPRPESYMCIKSRIRQHHCCHHRTTTRLVATTIKTSHHHHHHHHHFHHRKRHNAGLGQQKLTQLNNHPTCQIPQKGLKHQVTPYKHALSAPSQHMLELNSGINHHPNRTPCCHSEYAPMNKLTAPIIITPDVALPRVLLGRIMPAMSALAWRLLNCCWDGTKV
jgi:hypothetical protein